MFGFKEDSVFNVARFDSDMTVLQLCSVLEHLIDSGCGDYKVYVESCCRTTGVGLHEDLKQIEIA